MLTIIVFLAAILGGEADRVHPHWVARPIVTFGPF